MFWQLVLVAAAVGALHYRWSRRRLHRLAAAIPSGLKSYPIIGHAYKFFGNSEDRMLGIQDFGRIANRQGGLSSAWLGHELFICVTDPETIDLVTKTCLEKPEVSKILRTVIGNGSIFAPVNIWHPRRKINAPFFSIKNLNHLVLVFHKKSSLMADLMRAEVSGGDFSIWKYMTTYTFDSVCETAMDTKMNSQEETNHFILCAINEVSQVVSKRMLQPWLRSDFIFENLPLNKRFAYHKQRLYDFVDEIIKKKRNQETADAQNKDGTNSQANFIDMLIKSSGDKGTGYSDTELREEVLAMIIGGNDTSAVAASFTAVLLSRYPDVQDTVYRELREVFGESDRPVTPEDLPRLRYLEAVIKESLRLYPPGPIMARAVERDVLLPSGVTLVSGCSVVFNIWGAHRNPAHWGADAEQFRPERFLEPLPHAAMFIPFSYSVRGCIGATYAMFSAKTALATLLRRYRLLPPAGARASDLARPLPVKFDIMMKAVDNFIVRIEQRN